MGKSVNLTNEEWIAIHTCVLREYKRQYAKTIRDSLGRKKMLSDQAAQKWLALLHKVEAHIEMSSIQNG